MPWVRKKRYRSLLAAEATIVAVIKLSVERSQQLEDPSELVVSAAEIAHIGVQAATLEGVGLWS